MRVRTRFATVAASGVAAIGLALVPGAGSSQAAAPPSPWLQGGFNAANALANPLESVLTPATAASVRTQHTLSVAGDNQCHSSGAGVAFSNDYTYAVDGTNLSKFSTTSGARVWQVATNDIDQDYNAIAISHGLAVVSGNECGTSDPNGDVAAFRTSDGARVWQVVASGDGIAGAAVSGKFVVAYSRAGLESSPQFHVYDVQSGRSVWETSYPDAANLCDVQIGVVYGRLYERSCPGGDPSKESLSAVDLATGRVVWSKPGSFTVLRGDRDDTAAHHVFVSSSSGQVLDLNPKSGATRFALAGARSVLAVDPARVYATCGAGLVCGYDIADGHRLWSAADPGSATSAIVGGSVLYLDDGRVHNAGTGALVTTYPAAPRLVGTGHLAVVSGSTVTLRGR